jgi:DegV family protein with EDD domain
MSVKIVTDSSADLPPQLAADLGITVVPLYVRFGEQVYKDGIDISHDEFYNRLVRDSIHPSTIQPSPQDFTNAYKSLTGKDTEGIVSIHISNKLSGTMNSASQGAGLIENCPIEVIDSQVLSAGLALVVISAAKLARSGAGLKEVTAHVKQMVPSIHLEGLLDTLRFLLLGGRIGKAKALLGSLLNVKPILTLKEGEVMPAGQVRSRAKGMEKLIDFARAGKNIQNLAIAWNTTFDEGKSLADKIAAEKIISRDNILITRIGPMLGVHMGPGTLIVVYNDKPA